MNFNDILRNRDANTPAPLDLNKGDILDLTKEAPSLTHIIIGAGWDANVPGKDTYDLDISAFLLNKDGRVTNPRTQVVYFKQPVQQGISLDGDDLTGSNSDGGDDERIEAFLHDIPDDIQSIVFNVNIFDAVKKRQYFNMVKNSYIRLLDADDNECEIARYDLKEKASTATAVTFARLSRKGNGWAFEALGEALNVADLNQLLLRYM